MNTGITSFKALGIVFSIVSLCGIAEGKVLEMSDRFIPLKNEGMWLVMFYAPWCGHCKKLEPVWKHVEQSLSSYPLRIGRIDCTRFPSVASEFQVHGFPTIIFFKGDVQFQYEGDRTREDIVAFAKRLIGPPVDQIASEADFKNAQEKSEIFFLFAGEEKGLLWDSYYHMATVFQQHEFFYRSPSSVAENFSGVKEVQTVRVYKDSHSILYDDTEMFHQDADADRVHRSLADRKDEAIPEAKDPKVSPGNASLTEWIKQERFPKFVKITRGKFGHLMSTKKLLVMAVLDENRIGQVKPEMGEFREMLKKVLEKNIDRYRPHFQFGWTGTAELANTVAMQTLSLPNLLVINASTYQHYLPLDDPSRLTAEAVEIFLDDIIQGTAKSYGGSSHYVKMYRAYYELTKNIMDMWHGNPALTAVLFGLPLGFFALICYSVCCADIMDAEEDDEEEELIKADETHEKTE